MTVAVLALQGAFLEHEKMLEKLGADWFEIRQPRDLDRPFDGPVSYTHLTLPTKA